MIYEVAAAVEHIVSLVQHVERRQPVAPEAIAAFASTLKDSLETRCQKCWNPAEPENGSAHRSVAWHLHAAGEGADPDLLRAFASVVQAHAQEGEVVQPHHAKVVELALEWLPFAFTLWIDPGCVAVRTGSGPGAARNSAYDFDLLKSGGSASSVHVIWGQMVAQAAERHVPQLTVSSAAPRPVPIVKPTPTVALSRYPVSLFTDMGAQRHSRSPSTASSASSSRQGLVRSASLSSTHTVSTDATSVSGLDVDAADMDADSDACPSLDCSPVSSLASSHCTPSDRDSVHDTTVGGDATQRFAGIRLFNDDDDEAGDVTIDASPMLGLDVSKAVSSEKHALGAGFTPASKPVAASTPIKCNYTTHDNGNVGVLGGGVRLGGGTAKSQQAPRQRQHTASKSVSYLHTGTQGQLLPAYVPRAHMRPMQHMNAGNYSAPMGTVPLPPVALPLAHPQQAYQGGYAQQFQQYAAPQPRRALAPYALPGAYALPLPLPHQPQAQKHYPYASVPSTGGVHLDVSVNDDDDDACSAGGRRRLRSRGRRSRGRGAGRAARRQAAALRALELGTTDELRAFEFDDDDGPSRCSTPATTSEFESGSVYSSAASSPAKLAPRASRGDLRAFARDLHSGLARVA
ncbi:conserved hypothetical protein [Sporisorium reilianum SRZ2]|uniref:Anti-proliferative protein domain-containing protein n=1 Tax=Sporisorium reilianum (strain SRZ2) TaxID=999809 RepID=E7A0C7_SPORE|nr:conserved hypothetical protein [Sporisorium reilianum SRZ2]